MKAGPDIAVIASLVGDPARANMLIALVTGQALTAGELAREAGVTAQTASSHLARLSAAGLIVARPQGRHRYFSLSGDDVAAVLEGLMGLAARTGHTRTRPGPADPALRRARACYDHLAGEMGVAMLDGLIARGQIAAGEAGMALTGAGEAFVAAFGIDPSGLGGSRRPVCKGCLDWSVRREHLAGALGAALLQRIYALGWASRTEGQRIVAFTRAGSRAFEQVFGTIATDTVAV
jgi:DNA-binding transcriptional ArsR family regulator